MGTATGVPACRVKLGSENLPMGCKGKVEMVEEGLLQQNFRQGVYEGATMRSDGVIK